MSGRAGGRAEGLIARQVAPNNILAEQAVLGAMLLEPEALKAGVSALTAAMFFKAAHARIFAHLRTLHAGGQVVDHLILEHALRNANELDEVGGPVALAFLIEAAALNAHVLRYIEIIKEESAKRDLIKLGTDLVGAAYNGRPAQDIIDAMGSTMREISARRSVERSGRPELQRQGLDLTVSWLHGVRFALTAIRDGRDGVRGELTVTQGDRRLSWGAVALSSTQAREGLRKKLEAAAPGVPWGDYLEETAWCLTQAAREGEPLAPLTGHVGSPTRELVPGLLYEGEPTLVFADGDTGKSMFATAISAAVHAGVALPCGLRPARAVPTAYLDWETSQDTVESRVVSLAAGLGIDPPPILYKRMVRPLVDEAGALAVEFARRGVGLVVVDSKMFAVAGGEGAAFHEPITQFYGALRLFAPAASLILNHVTNADARSGTPARPFGGAFAFNGPRLIWEAKRDQDITDAIAIVFTCKKANNLPRRPEPFGLRFQPGDGSITVSAFDLAEAAPQTTAGASLSQRIRLALTPGALTVGELAEHLGVKEGTVGRVLRRLAKADSVVRVSGDAQGGRGKEMCWGLRTYARTEKADT